MIMQDKIKSSTGFSNSRKWNARWIWDTANIDTPNIYYYFRKSFNLTEPPSEAHLYVTADTSYKLFINGQFVGRGAPQSQPFFQYYDNHEVSKFLKNDTNCIAVIVNHVGNQPDTRGGLLLELTDEDGKKVVGTDGSWKLKQAQAWKQDTQYFFMNKAFPYQEFFDANKEPEGWKEIAFNDGSWADASVVSGGRSRSSAVMPWSRLVPRDIPFMHEEKVHPVAVERIEESLDLHNRSRSNDLAPGLSMVGNEIKYCRVESADALCSDSGKTIVQSSLNHLDLDFDGIYAPAIILDFAKVVTARTQLAITAPAGCCIEIGYAERLIDGHFNIALECEFANRYITKEGKQVFESFWWYSFRYMKIRFRKCFEPVTIHSLQANTTTYPFEEKGGFSSTDETLNGVFEISRRTVRLCSNECLMDTPWREQAQWLGDVALVTVPAIHACFGDTALIGKFLRQAAENRHQTGMLSNISNSLNHNWQGSIPDYSLWWIKGLLDQYQYTGEERWIHNYYPQASGIILAHMNYLNENGLIENMPYWVFIDWADIDRRGECTAYNAIFFGALEAILPMAELKKDLFMIELVKQTMQRIKDSFQKLLFNTEKGCFADARVDGELSEMISEHANFAAIRYGLCDNDCANDIIDAFFVNKTINGATEAQPFFMAVVLAALDRMQRSDVAIKLIRDRWGKRMLDKGATSVYEEWYNNGSWRNGEFDGFLRSHSHAWSACPANFLIRNLIGLEIIEPGCTKIRLAPKEPGFDYEVIFPLPKGNIEVNHQAGKTAIKLPDGVELFSDM